MQAQRHLAQMAPWLFPSVRHPPPFTSALNPQLTSTSPQGWRRPFHSPHLRRRLHTPSHHPAPLRWPGPPPQISHDRRSRVLHESLHFQRDNASRAARRLRQELLGGTESQHASFRGPGSVFEITWSACKSDHPLLQSWLSTRSDGKTDWFSDGCSKPFSCLMIPSNQMLLMFTFSRDVVCIYRRIRIRIRGVSRRKIRLRRR